MSFFASALRAVYKLSGAKKSFTLPEEEILKVIEKQNRSRGVFIPTDRKACYEMIDVNGFPCLIVRAKPEPSERAILYFFGGEQQRIAIARAMLKNAPVLILDEATAFADPDNEAKVQAVFEELAKGKTVIMIAHRLSTVVNADCIYVVRDGQIEEAGTKDELCAKDGLFARMWRDYQSSVEWKVAKEG